MRLPSQDLYYYLVLDCLYIEHMIYGRDAEDPIYELSNAEILERLRTALLLTTEDLHDEKRTRKVFDAGRVNRALADLVSAGLIERVKRGVYQISERGLKVGDTHPTTAGIAKICRDAKSNPDVVKSELLDSYFSQLSHETEDKEDYERAMECEALLFIHCVESTPGHQLFEDIACQIVAKKTGLRCEPTRYTGDGGIDGECYDKDGNLVAVIQAKRYRGTKRVNHIPVHQLIGYCATHKVPKGYLVTTSTFAQSGLDALGADSGIEIEGIDGLEVAQIYNELTLEPTSLDIADEPSCV